MITEVNIKDYIEKNIGNYYKDREMEFLNAYLKVDVKRYKGFRIGIHFIHNKEVKYIEQFIPQFVLEHAIYPETILKKYMDSTIQQVINIYENNI